MNLNSANCRVRVWVFFFVCVCVYINCCSPPTARVSVDGMCDSDFGFFVYRLLRLDHGSGLGGWDV